MSLGTLLKILAIGLALLLIAGGQFALWTFRFSGPSLETRQTDSSVTLANVTLGEYYLGFTEVEIRHEATGQLFLHALKGEGELITRLELGPDVDIRKSLVTAGWTMAEYAPNWTPSAGESYRVIVHGNNGFGYSNRATRIVNIPQLGADRMSNRASALTVTSLAAQGAPIRASAQ